MTPQFSASSPILSISTLNRLVRESLESAFPLSWVAGEISNLTYAASGHVYFSLKDANAQVRCVMWRNKAQLLGWRLENGQKIEARTLVSFYEPRGEFQLNVEAIRQAGQGDLFEQFLRLKARLEGEGLFDPATRRQLPAHPGALAIVTSPQAAALQDVLKTLQRRAPQLPLEIYPTPVQGEGAAARIAAAITRAGQSRCDAILLCRGGGSIEDLWAFNDEALARAIRASPIPVVSGIGHETDFTIADFAADLRAATPTAAAELLSPDREALLARLAHREFRLRQQTSRFLAGYAQQLDWLASRLTHPAERLQQQHAILQSFGRRARHAQLRQQDKHRHALASIIQSLANARPRTASAGEQLRHVALRLFNAARWQNSSQRMKLNTLAGSLKQLDPHAVLARGYAIAIDSDGNAVRDAGQLEVGDELRLSFAKGGALGNISRLIADPPADESFLFE
jgi:exodeoxyribonuclease VII large subunit